MHFPCWCTSGAGALIMLVHSPCWCTRFAGALAFTGVSMTFSPGGWRTTGGGSSSNYCSGSSRSDYFAGCDSCSASCLADCSARTARNRQVSSHARYTRVSVRHRAHISLCTSMVTRMGRVTARAARHSAKDSQEGPLLMSSYPCTFSKVQSLHPMLYYYVV